ncbi:putative cinnamoyl-CoA reductase [Aspergillus steynii IBT 23096]|uniref:Putative cinnamoyl-CoA reductase n=1 Tax=Aspergillus steynii IBT 23096 TaxID=1392250 RepID=A0A2I2GM46_9EURO|nr:putative cinnamoyl-CoA reductase [Aspergillus steynii IBT 23096]PLB53947.1 putative cinnamoyl-CoA reductase [Aspergillus steynii IBT 23096]
MPETVLITGISGYVGAHIAHTFLSAGYNVRGTLRSMTTAPAILSRYRGFENNLTFVSVPDIAAPHAFDDAVKDVVGVIHTASPFVLDVTNNEKDLLLPAIRGTTNVLDAVGRTGPAVRRVVVTSSFAAVLDLAKGNRPGYRYTEMDWNPVSYADAKGAESASVAYCASKAFAERAVWEWVRDHEPRFSVVSVNPPWVFGPGVDGGRLNESLEAIQKLVDGSRSEVPGVDFAGFADVRDLATAHLRAFEVEEAAGKRFLVANGKFDYQAAVDIVRRRFPELKGVPVGRPGVVTETYEVDGGRAREVLGLEYRSLESTLVDTVRWLVENGHV